jgi:hypothetical protein
MMRFDDVGGQQQMKVEIGEFVLTSILKLNFFRAVRRFFTYENRLWREWSRREPSDMDESPHG